MWFVVVVVALCAYLYGIKVGMKAGVTRGRVTADSEWAQWAEHGAMPTPETR